MDLELRPGTTDDHAEILRVDGVAFGDHFTEQDAEDALGAQPPQFTVATVADQIVGVTGHYDFTMTVPGGGALQVPGVTWVSVSPVHRRRGVLRALMDRQVRDFAALGVPAAILTASEGGIYGRFGYGPASSVRKTVLDRRVTRLVQSGQKTSGEVQVLNAEQARSVLPELHRRWREQVPGALNRTEAWWDHLFLDREQHRGGMSAKFYLTHPEGYVSYRVKEQWNDGIAALQCRIVDYVISSTDAHAALWQVLLGMDLFESIESHQIPVDDPLPFLVNDFRQVRTTAVNDGVWVRPIDAAATLAARTYPVEVEAVIEVVDPLLGDRRLVLAGGPDGASCRPTDRPAQASFSLAGLGSAYLGGHRLSTLARAGVLRCDDPRLLSRLELAFSTDRAPFYGTAF
ncbi:MAG TPA: GNAT family N-acetyltransferase [Jatrophihabitans sp.]|uniref:GNAT family N-acetyltransferase n=1 Tax=Jatrophihabitans sp. TaxID=1932789 RepID=UPI002EEDF52F